jgi:hypothetical protein
MNSRSEAQQRRLEPAIMAGDKVDPANGDAAPAER